VYKFPFSLRGKVTFMYPGVKKENEGVGAVGLGFSNTGLGVVQPLQAEAVKYVQYILSLDPPARSAVFSANKMEIAVEFDKMKGCRRCEFVQFVFSLFDQEGPRPVPWILPRAQLMAVLSPHGLVNLMQFDWKDEQRVVPLDSLLVEDRLLSSFLYESIDFMKEVQRDWEECDKHRGYPGPAELQSTAHRLLDREAECNRELLRLQDAAAAAAAAGSGTEPRAPSAQQQSPWDGLEHSPQAMAAMEELSSRWGVRSETLEALVLLGDRMASQRGLQEPGASPMRTPPEPRGRDGSWQREEAGGQGAALHRRPPAGDGGRHGGRQTGGGAVGRWGLLLGGTLRDSAAREAEWANRSAVGRWGALLSSLLDTSSVESTPSGSRRSSDNASASRAPSDTEGASANGQRTPPSAPTPDAAPPETDEDERELTAAAGGPGTPGSEAAAQAWFSPEGGLRGSTADLPSPPCWAACSSAPAEGRESSSGRSLTEGRGPRDAPWTPTTGWDRRVRQLQHEVSQVRVRRGRLERACEHGVVMGARRLLAIMLTVSWRRLIATCQAAETRSVMAALLWQPKPPAASEAGRGPGRTPPPAEQPWGPADGAYAAPAGNSEASNAEDADPVQVQRCLGTISALQEQLRGCKRELRAAQLREAEAVESGSLALMEADELRDSLKRVSDDLAAKEAEVQRMKGVPDAIAGLGRAELRELAEQLEAAASSVRSAEAVAAAEAQALCPVCLASRKDMAFSCGHQTCCSCGNRLAACPICRQEISLRIRLF